MLGELVLSDPRTRNKTMSISEVDIGSIPLPPQEVEGPDQARPKIDLVGGVKVGAAKLEAFSINLWF